LSHGGCEFSPGALFGFQLLLAGTRELVKFGASVVFRSSPVRLDPAATLQSVQSRIQRALLNFQNVARDLAQPCCGPSASVFKINKSSVPCGNSMRSLTLSPCASTGRIAVLLSKHKGRPLLLRPALDLAACSSRRQRAVTTPAARFQR